MGQSQSKDPTVSVPTPIAPKTESLIDYGSLRPQGIYPPSDFDSSVVCGLIQSRRLAPYYKGLADEPVIPDTPGSPETSPVPSPSHSTRERTVSGSGGKGKDREWIACKQENESLKKLYGNGAVECPICFLYYPENVNHARCCDQPICTECFVQIRRPPESPITPANCPFCVEPNFGVTYRPPEWSTVFQKRYGTPLTREGSDTLSSSLSIVSSDKQRRKSISYKDPEVVTVDMIRPNWNHSLLESTRPDSRRNSFSSAFGSNYSGMSRRFVGRTGGSNYLTAGGSSRPRTVATGTEYGGYAAAMRNMNMDLEELMVMEAIRISLLDQEARENKERDERAAEEAAGGSGSAGVGTSMIGEAQDGPSALRRAFQDNIDTDDDSNSEEEFHTDPIINVTEHSSSSTSSPLSWGSRNKPMPLPPPHEDAGSSSPVGVRFDFKTPIQEVGEASVIE